jgi:hypothetical protein
MPLNLLSSSQFLTLTRLTGVIVLASFLAGCSLPLLFKLKNPEKTFETALKHDPKSGKLTQAGLQAEVMDFSDHYVLLLWQGLDEIIRGGVDSERRIRINPAKVVYSSARPGACSIMPSGWLWCSLSCFWWGWWRLW